MTDEQPVSPEKVKELLLLRHKMLLLLLPYRKMIEEAATYPDIVNTYYFDGIAPTTFLLPLKALVGVAKFMSAEFNVWVDGNFSGKPVLDVGDVVVTDDKCQQFVLEIYCNPDQAKRRALEETLQAIIEAATDMHRNQLLEAMGVTTEEGIHINLLHRVAGVIEYSSENKGPHEK